MSQGLLLRGIEAGYRSRRVLGGVNLEAPRGQITAVLGPNGSGKSTLLKAALGILPSSEGEVSFDGVDLRSLSAAERAHRLAYVPQRTQLSARLTVEQVVEMGRFAHRGPLALASQEDQRRVASAMVDAGVDMLAGRSFLELSGGERQRVLLARALATGAECLLLDEPTSALDVKQALLLHRVLRRLADEGASVVVVLHDLMEARQHADRALLLQEGVVVSEGMVEEVLEKDLVRRVYGVWMREAEGVRFELPEDAE